MLFIESMFFNILMAPINGLNALLDLIENHSDYPSNRKNIHSRQIQQLFNAIRDHSTAINWGQIKLFMICFILPPLAVFHKKGGLFNLPFLFNFIGLLLGFWPFVIIHALYVVKYQRV